MVSIDPGQVRSLTFALLEQRSELSGEMRFPGLQERKNRRFEIEERRKLNGFEGYRNGRWRGMPQ